MRPCGPWLSICSPTLRDIRSSKAACSFYVMLQAHPPAGIHRGWVWPSPLPGAQPPPSPNIKMRARACEQNTGLWQVVRGPPTSQMKTLLSWPVLPPRAGGAPIFLHQAIRQFLRRESSRGVRGTVDSCGNGSPMGYCLPGRRGYRAPHPRLLSHQACQLGLGPPLKPPRHLPHLPTAWP